jgi:PAS domain S-box-containing protein
MLGYPYGTLHSTQENWASLIHPDDRARVLDELNSHIQGETSFYQCEYRMRTKDGSWKWILDRGMVVEREDDGTPLRASGTHLDITEQKMAQVAISESEKRYRTIIQSMKDLIVVLDKNNSYTQYHSSDDSEHYMDSEEILGRHVAEVLPPDVAQLNLETFSTVRATGKTISIDYPLEINKETHWFAASINLHEDGEGVVSVMRDITPRKRAEMELRSSEEKYRTLVETSPDSIILTDLDGSILYVSNQTLDMLHASQDYEITGKSALDLIGPAERDLALADFEAAISEGMFRTAEYRVQRVDGTNFSAEISASIVKGDGMEPIGYIIVARDISDRKAAQAELQTERDRAMLYLDLMSHDIRNKLQAILGGSEYISGISQDEDVESAVANVIEAADECSKMIAKIKKTEQLTKIPLERTRLCDILQKTVDEFKIIHPNANITLVIPNRELDIAADEFLDDMLFTLLENAIDHNPSHPKRIWISLIEEGDGYSISVADNGRGVSNHQKESLFDLKTHTAGVGLHQVRQIAEKYKGTVQVADRIEGKPTMGAEFLVWLPRLNGKWQ